MKDRHRTLLTRFLHAVLLLIAIDLFMAFNYFPHMTALAAGVIAISVYLERNDKEIKLRLCFFALILIFMAAGCFTDRFSIHSALAALVSIFAMAIAVMDARRHLDHEHSTFGQVLGVLGFAVLIVAGSMMVFFAYCAVDPTPAAMIFQSGSADYPTDVEESVEVIGDVTIYRDVTYESAYPNNTYTVYSIPDSKGTFFYVHGGGLVFGDKELGSQNIYLDSMVDSGYCVVTVDYVLAPQNPYPQGITAVNDALRYFVNHAGDYEANIEGLFVGGDSGGSQLSGQLALLQTNRSYADEVGIVPALDGTGFDVDGYISISGLVDMPRFGNMHMFVFDWFGNVCGRSVFGEIDYEHTELAHQASILENVDANFPPSYVSDANFGSFYDQGKDLVKRLQELGVYVEGNFPDNPVLLHIWELNTHTPSGAENFTKTLKFMDTVLAMS